MPYQVEVGKTHPLGATPDAQGVNFSIFSEHATSAELLLFDTYTSTEPMQTIRLDPFKHRTFHFWHAYVRDLRPGVHYAYRMDGPQDVAVSGHRFNRNKVLIDPYARGNTLALWNRAAAAGPYDNLATSMRSTVIDTSHYDWEGDRPLNRPMRESIIYELHVGGFTRSPSSGCKHPGTFIGIVEKIPYLLELGITAIELLPIFAFDPAYASRKNPITGQALSNYWGYDPICHFAPHPAYGLDPGEGDHIRDFRDMVKALHKAGIEVILDVVFNHTSESDDTGPIISFKGLDNSIYYYLDSQDKRHYIDYSGCGNTFNCNHPIAIKLIAQCLEFWVNEMHVDGFRFDEGSVLTRGEDGEPMKYPTILWLIELDDALAETKIIAEPWDAAGLYQVGNFPGYRWTVWNGRYRDDIRRFVKGDPGMIGTIATRLSGSSDLFQVNGHMPINGINFITCHDGFTLNDLVAYNVKHNEVNGENNRDGLDVNFSWNCGVEGESDDPTIEGLRLRQMRNFIVFLLLAQGTPMFTAGDEVRRTQKGNNNAYCQNNEISWFDWSLCEKNAALWRFCKNMIAFRKAHPTLCREHFFTGEPDAQGRKDIDWHGCKLNSPEWFDPNARVLACTLWGQAQDTDLHIMLNMDEQDFDFDIPLLVDRKWYRAIDTFQPAPADIVDVGCEIMVNGNSYHVGTRSVVVLLAQ